jgi:paired amphipathic helix protein Sin3a
MNHPFAKHHVHAQVRTLFKEAPDLLLEFKDFLPDLQPGFSSGVLPLPAGISDGLGFPWQKQEIGSGSTDRKKATTTPKRKKRPTEKESTPAPAAKSAQNRVRIPILLVLSVLSFFFKSQPKKSKHSHKLDSPPLSYSPYQGSVSPQHMQMYPQTHMATYQPPQQLSHVLHSSHNIAQGSMSTPDEAMFFDRVRKTLELRETYDDFLKFLNLFHKDIIDTKTLVERAQMFLGESDLLMQFKDILGWDDKQQSVEHGPPGSIRTGPPEALTAMPVDDGEGPSYRKLPESVSNFVSPSCTSFDRTERRRSAWRAQVEMSYVALSLTTNGSRIQLGLPRMQALLHTRRTVMKRPCTRAKRSDTSITSTSRLSCALLRS